MNPQLKALVEIMAARPVLTRKDLAQRYGVTLRCIELWHARGTLPPGHYLPGSNSPHWRPFEIESNERKSPKLKNKLPGSTKP